MPTFILQSLLLSGYAPRLARRSTDEAVAVGHIFRVDGVEVCQHKLRVGMIAKIGITHSRFELIGPNHLESRLLKAKVKTSASCKE